VRGFTLIELIVSVAILVSFFALGVPKMQGMIERHESSTSFHTLRKALVNARGLAQSKILHVSVCPMENTDCTNNWNGKITIFNDQNLNNSIDPNEELYFNTNIHSRHGYWLKTKPRQTYIRFNPLGHAFSSASTFLYCPFSNLDNIAKSIVISFQGRIRTTPYLNKHGSPYNHFESISCD
jgi:type IV fimbrial biogenesis protein FimT